jgi:hypothetical protein
MNAQTKDEAARLAARAVWGSDEIEFDDDARVSHSENADPEIGDGAWVQAWVYVAADDIALETRKRERAA